jgi:hypothetical protein
VGESIFKGLYQVFGRKYGGIGMADGWHVASGGEKIGGIGRSGASGFRDV